jgi:hypothetical protein
MRRRFDEGHFNLTNILDEKYPLIYMQNKRIFILFVFLSLFIDKILVDVFIYYYLISTKKNHRKEIHFIDIEIHFVYPKEYF